MKRQAEIKRICSIIICAATMICMLATDIFAPGSFAEPLSAQTEGDENISLSEISLTASPAATQAAPADGGEDSISAQTAETPTPAPETTTPVPESGTETPPPPVSVAQIAISGPDALTAGEQTQLSAAVLPENAANTAVLWSSSDETVATVAQDGTLSALLPGEVTVTAAAQDGSGVSAEHAVIIHAPASSSVEIDPEKLRLGVGQSAKIGWKVLPALAAQQVSFETSDKKIATVTADGEVRGVGAGVCTITVATVNGKYNICTVTVTSAPGTVQLQESAVALGFDAESGVGETWQLRPRTGGGAAAGFTYSSNNEAAAKVDGSGLITATGLGEATITVTTHNGVSASCKVAVGPAPEELWFGSVIRLSVGDTIAPEIELRPAGTTARLNYMTGNPHVMKVSEDGEITGVAPGAAILTVETFNGVKLTRSVKVTLEPAKVVAADDQMTIAVGQKKAIEAWIEPAAARSALTYKSSQTKTVTVDPDGIITGVRTGTATITITAYNGKKDTVKVTVKKAPTGVTLNAEKLVLGWDAERKLGEKARLSAKLSSGSAGTVEFFSSDPWVAHVDSRTGEVTARGLGTAKITAVTFNGKSASCTVEVKEAPQTLTIAEAAMTLGVGQSYSLKPDMQGGTSAITYASSDEDAVTVSAAGKITALERGEATVTASTFNGHKASLSVKVLGVPSKVTLAQSSATIGVGGTFRITPVLPDGTAAGFTYTSSDKKIAIVDAGGEITGVAPGSATITVKTHNGKKCTFAVKVVKAPDSIAFSRAELIMQPTEVQVLKASLPGGTAANITFTSSDERIATVDGSGRVEAVAIGECTITAATHNGKLATCKVVVIEGPASIRVPADMMIGTGELVTPEIEVLMASGELYEGGYTLTSSDSSVVSVSGTSLLGGSKAGVAIITARSHARTAQFNVEVVKYASLHPSKVFAHRGASAYAVENTLEAFRLANEMGADGVELDVRKTKDGVLVLFHDASLIVDKVEYVIADMTLAELQAIDLQGSRVPTLDEALDYIATTGMSVQVEMKDDGIGAECAQAVINKGLRDRAIYISFSLAALDEVKAADSSARLGYVFKLLSFDVATVARQHGLYALLPTHSIVDEALVESIHGAGLYVGTWTVNDAKTMTRMSQLGVDFIATDKPDLASVIR